ncbi:hypothetical protein V6N12_005197 [Hibiscus sabdariffa]|uniref:RNase H type-1 domain-containing protein n=1 Tax=Hibiscus sabdariffa TaxID=183260 RepID=A0ABR2CNR4_9ROSI
MPGHCVSNVDAKVVDMVDASGNWNFAEFGPLLPMKLRLRIAATCPPKQGLTDCVLWNRTDTGCFQGYSGRHESIAQASLRLQHECIQSLGATGSSNDVFRRANRQGVRWQKPPEGWWKLNSDGAAVSGSGLSSCGLLVVWSIGSRRLIIEVDSVVVADLIRDYRSDVSTYSLVPHIAALLDRSRQVEIMHVLREGNQLADSMAKFDWLDDFIGHRFSRHRSHCFSVWRRSVEVCRLMLGSVLIRLGLRSPCA